MSLALFPKLQIIGFVPLSAWHYKNAINNTAVLKYIKQANLNGSKVIFKLFPLFLFYKVVFLASLPKIDDKIRLSIMESLLKHGTVVPNVRQIQKATGLHKATIKSSLDFFKKEGLLQGFGPKIGAKRFGYSLEVFLFLQADTSQKKIFEKFLEVAEKDPHLYRISSIIGSGNWNLLLRFIYKDVESFHTELQKHYYDAIPGFYELVKSRQVFYETEPRYKSSSRTDSIITIITREKGLD